MLQRNSFEYLDVDAVDDDLKCVICSEPMIDPVLHKKCKNHFCCACLNKCKSVHPESTSSHNNRLVCPLCRSDASNSQAPVSLYIENILNRIPVQCKECATHLVRGQMIDHYDTCSRACQYHCGAVILANTQIEHNKICTTAPTSCIGHSKNCPWLGTHSDKSVHQTQCEFALLVQEEQMIDKLNAERDLQVQQILQKYEQPVARATENIKRLKQQLIQLHGLTVFGGSMENELKMGTELDCLDTLHHWCPARVISMDDARKNVYIHFVGWSTRWHQWYPINSDKLAKKFTYTTSQAWIDREHIERRRAVPVRASPLSSDSDSSASDSSSEPHT